MATMYSLFLGFLFTAVCSVNGNGGSVVGASMPAQGIFILLDQNEAKTQGYIPLCYSLSKPLSKMELSRHIGIKHHFALNGSCSKELSSRNTRPIYSGTARNSTSSRRVPIYRGLKRSVIEGSISKVTGNVRNKIINIASKELGTHEATGKNDGPRVEEYLRYTNLGSGYEWCAAFVSWVYGQAGLDVPRNPWSPALFPKARQIDKAISQPADVFGIYGISARRINHVGLVKEKVGEYLLTVEGNSNDRVESRRRHIRTVYAMANWVK